MTRAVAFLAAGRPPDLAERFARLRWRRACGAASEMDCRGDEPAASAFSGSASEGWVLVAEPAAIPLGRVPEPAPKRVSCGRAASLAPGTFAHTLRELEQAGVGPAAGAVHAVAFRPADFVAPRNTTIKELFRQLQADDTPQEAPFAVLLLEEPSDRERPEITGRLPAGPLRILDAGCGAGGLGLARARHPAWEVVGIEKDPIQAARARGRCSAVVEGDLTEALPRLAAAGKRFDAIVFADVLEHLEDPIAALGAARRLSREGGLLVASVPNAAHLSIARDLLLGRFDPAPSGLCDAGHLRWFTRDSLAEALAEGGWTAASIDAEPGAPSPAAEAFLQLAQGWPEADPRSLATYQWIAVAHAR